MQQEEGSGAGGRRDRQRHTRRRRHAARRPCARKKESARAKAAAKARQNFLASAEKHASAA
eukprot:3674049-Prymnesium_polylepis.1